MVYLLAVTFAGLAVMSNADIRVVPDVSRLPRRVAHGPMEDHIDKPKGETEAQGDAHVMYLSSKVSHSPALPSSPYPSTLCTSHST